MAAKAPKVVRAPMALTPAEKRLRSQAAAHSKWKRCGDPTAATAKARDKFDERFYDEVDPNRLLPETERERRAEHARQAYFAKLALKSAKARRKNAADATNGTLRTKDAAANNDTPGLHSDAPPG
jgi:hypothetical protein